MAPGKNHVTPLPSLARKKPQEPTLDLTKIFCCPSQLLETSGCDEIICIFEPKLSRNVKNTTKQPIVPRNGRQIPNTSLNSLFRQISFSSFVSPPLPLPPLCVSGCLQSGRMARGLWLNPQPRRLHSPSLPHRESCIDCCFSPPSLLMGTLHCEGPLAL